MTAPALLTLYCSVIAAGAVAGALVPVYAAQGTRLVTFLSFAAGVMFGAAFFHMVPEAFHGGGYRVFPLLPVGFICLFLLERYVLVHACEEPPDCAEHGHGKALGLTAFLGLSVHTLFDGVALGSGVAEGVGFTAFVAIAAHKVPSSLSLAAILKTEGRRSAAVVGYGLAYGLMVPVGVALYYLLSTLFPFEAFAPRALAFSAGTFLYIAVSDLLPRMNRHGRQGRLGNVAALIGGLAVMFGLSLVTGHEHAGVVISP